MGARHGLRLVLDRARALRAVFDPRARIDRQEVAEALANSRRRFIVRYLRRQDRRVNLRDLVDQLVRWENGSDPGSVSPDERKSISIAIRRTHLPTLAEANLLEYDPKRETVEPTEALGRVEFSLEPIPEETRPWPLYYLGLSGLLGGVLVATWAGIYPFTLVSEEVASVVAVTIFVATAILHCRSSRR